MTAVDKIVVGIDGSPSSIQALEWAATQAEAAGVSVMVVMTWEWPVFYGWTPEIPSGWDPSADAGNVANEAVESIRADHPSVTFEVAILEGHPAPALVDLSATAALLVVGSRGHGEFAGMLLGSVSEYCVTHAHCPVVVVRAKP